MAESKKITAAQAKEAARDPTSAGAKAIREKVLADMKKQRQAAFREAYNQPLAKMSRNSTSWSMLEQGKDAAKKVKWPEKAIGKMTVKQDALHQANVETAKPYDIRYDAASGTWRGGESYGEWKGAQVYDAQKALPLPTSGDALKGMRDSAAQAQAYKRAHPETPEQAAERKAKDAQRAKETLMWPVHQTMAAIGGVTGSFYDTANMVLETTGIDKFLPDAVKNYIKNSAKIGHGVQEQVRAVNYERGGKLGGAVGDLAQLGVEMLGQYALAAATGGASAGAQLGAKTGTVSKALETIAKSPNFWYSFVRTAGPEYEEAKANGASGPQAAVTAILSALGQAGVEVGGGVETLAGTPAAAGVRRATAKGGTWRAAGVKGAVKSMLEEGGEEAMQDLISGLAHKGVYDQGRAWLGSGDSGAVVNPQRMAGEFAMGALGAGLPVGVNALMNRGKTYSLPLPRDAGTAKAGQGTEGYGLPTSFPEASTGAAGRNIGLPTSFPETGKTKTAGLPLPTSFPETGKTKTAGLPLPTSFPETGKTKTAGLPLPTSFPAQAKTQTVGLPTSFPEAGKQAQGLPLPTSFSAQAKTQTTRQVMPDVRQEATSIDTNPETHTPEQMVQIKEYIDSADDGLLDFTERYAENPNAKFGRYTISPVSDRQAHDISGILGEDFSGFKNAINKNGVNHIIRRHGVNGQADHSMANLSDVSRIGYVLDNYDAVERVLNDDGTPAVSQEFRGKDNQPAPMVRFAKKIDGTYYVVEAAADNAYKKLWVVSAYINKDGTVTQVPNAVETTLGGTSETLLASPSSVLNQSMPQAGAEVKGQEIPNPGILRQTPWQEGETKPRLGGEHETRPEAARRLTAGEEYEIGKQLDDWLERQEAGQTADTAAKIGPSKGLPLPDSAAKAQGQLDTLASDSYQIPDIIRQEEAAVRRAENAEQARGQLDALDSDSYRGPEPEGQERMTFAEQMSEAAQARGERIAANHPVRRATVRAEASPMDAHAPDAEAAIQAVNGLEGMRQALKRLERQFKLSQADLVTAKELSKGRRPTRELDADRLEKVETYAKLLREYESAMQPFYDYKTQLETARQEAADELLTNADSWKDVKLGASLSANTAERVFEIVAGKDGARLIDSLARPVHEHDAQRNRWENGYRDRLRGIIKGTTREESHYAAMKNYAEYLERAGMDSSKLRTAMADYLKKNRKKIDMGRVETLENALIALTQEMHPEVNETRIRNGYTPLEFTSRYLPALHRADEGGAVTRVLRKMFGIETRADALPTEIAGTTANRRPGQPWQSFAMERTGDTGKFNPKDFDAVRAVDEYITQAGREIFFTDDIQNWRTFEERLRYRFSDEGTRAELDSIDADPDMDAGQKLAEKTKLWERDQYSLPHFPTWLRKYADTLAGKKQLIDRAAFSQLRRVSMQIPSSLATSVLGRPCSVTIRIAPALNASSYRGGAIPFLRLFSISFVPFPFHYNKCFLSINSGKGAVHRSASCTFWW